MAPRTNQLPINGTAYVETAVGFTWAAITNTTPDIVLIVVGDAAINPGVAYTGARPIDPGDTENITDLTGFSLWIKMSSSHATGNVIIDGA